MSPVSVAHDRRDLRVRHLRSVCGGQDLPLGIVRVRRCPEANGRRVRLGCQRQESEQLGRTLDAENENTGRHGIQRPGVSHLPGVQQLAAPSDHVVAGDTRLFVDNQNSGADKTGGRLFTS